MRSKYTLGAAHRIGIYCWWPRLDHFAGSAVEAAVSEVVERFRRIVRERPERPLIFRPATRDVLTAGEVWARAVAVRESIIEQRGRPGSPVLSLCGNSSTGVALLLAARMLGMPLMPAERGSKASELSALCTRFNPGLLVSPTPMDSDQRTPSGLLDEGLAIVRIGPEAEDGRLPADIAVLKLSSGSSGLPRATLTSEDNLLADGAAIIEAMDIRPVDVQMASIPLSHAYGLGNLVLPLLLQGTAIVLREGFVPPQFAHDAHLHGVTMFPGVPFMFDHLAEHLPKEAWPSTLSRLISAGAPLEASTVHRFHRAFELKIHSFYGTTETGGICYDASPLVESEPTVGRPMPGVRVTLQPHDGAPPGGGRVHVAGPAVVAGYMDESATLDEEESPFSDGGFLTGDLGVFDTRGQLAVRGRVSSFVNVAGRKVQPREVEEVLRQVAGLTDVRVVGAPDPRRGEQLVACIVAPRGGVDTAALRTFCAARLAGFKVPRQYVFLERIPLTARGKTDRAALNGLVRQAIERGR